MELLNSIVWMIVVAGIMYATHSKHVCDGVLIKIGLIGLALGAAAQSVKPTYYSQLWIGASVASIVIFFILRVALCKMRGKKPEFFAF